MGTVRFLAKREPSYFGFGSFGSVINQTNRREASNQAPSTQHRRLGDCRRIVDGRSRPRSATRHGLQPQQHLHGAWSCRWGGNGDNRRLGGASTAPVRALAAWRGSELESRSARWNVDGRVHRRWRSGCAATGGLAACSSGRQGA